MKKKVIGFALSAMLLALCLPAKAQQPVKVARIGFLSSSGNPVAFEAFQQGLRGLGYLPPR